MQKHLSIVTALLLSLLGTLPAAAAANKLDLGPKLTLTRLEWRALPRMCRVPHGPTGYGVPLGEQAVHLSKDAKALRWKVGGWHYCNGLVLLNRARMAINPQDKKVFMDEAYKWMLYSYQRIDLKQPWAAEMSLNMARVLLMQGKPEAAIKILDKARPLHPHYAPIYLGYAAILFKTKDYAKAARILAAGNKATGDRNGELQYFLGLAMFHTGNIQAAKRYAAKARANHYLMQYLPRQLAKYDRERAAGKKPPPQP